MKYQTSKFCIQGGSILLPDGGIQETDILISKDLIPVITHDFRLDPSFTKDNEGNWITDENIIIFDLSYDELLKFDVGSLNKLSRYGRRFVNKFRN